jgi:hypothetical protein
VKSPGVGGSFWPSERQKLLLRTATAGGDESVQAWRLLRPQLGLDRLELGSFPVLPLVHRQLAAAGVDDPEMPRLAGIRRRIWTTNQLQLGAVRSALRSLDQPIVVSGWQFPAYYYGGDFGLRPVESLATLDRFAWEFSTPDREPEVETIEIELGGTKARALAPSDELVRVCLAGARTSVPPNILWIADALAVLQFEIDWDRVVRVALRLRAMLRLRDALVYLRQELGAAVPEVAIRELEACPPRRREAIAHARAGRSARLVSPRFLQVTADRSLTHALFALPTFLRDELGVERRAQVPIEIVRRRLRPLESK